MRKKAMTKLRHKSLAGLEEPRQGEQGPVEARRQIALGLGSVWQGSLKPRGSGSADEPVVIESYGPGARPRIDGTGADAVRLENFSHVVLQGLELTNRGDGSSPRRGVHIVAAETGTVAGVVVRNLFIHDVNGTIKQKDNGGIISAHKASRLPVGSMDCESKQHHLESRS